MESLIRFGVSIPPGLLGRFDELCARKGAANRSEAIRDLIRDALVQEEQEIGGEMVGALTLVYNHHVREISDVLTDYQHRHVHQVVSSLHVHLDAHFCLEVIILRGPGPDLRRFSDRLLGMRGVQHGKLVLTLPNLGAARGQPPAASDAGHHPHPPADTD